METFTEGVLCILKDAKITHIVRRDEVSRSQVVYKVVECGMEDIKELIDTAIKCVPPSE